MTYQSEKSKSERFRLKHKLKKTYTTPSEEDENEILFSVKTSNLVRYVMHQYQENEMEENEMDIVEENEIYSGDELMRRVTRLRLDYSRMDYPVEWKKKHKSIVDFSNDRCYEFLKVKEKEICNVFRISPEKYLNILLYVINFDREFERRGEYFIKSNAQYVIRGIIPINSNIVCELWDLFREFGWIRGYEI